VLRRLGQAAEWARPGPATSSVVTGATSSPWSCGPAPTLKAFLERLRLTWEAGPAPAGPAPALPAQTPPAPTPPAPAPAGHLQRRHCLCPGSPLAWPLPPPTAPMHRAKQAGRNCWLRADDKTVPEVRISLRSDGGGPRRDGFVAFSEAGAGPKVHNRGLGTDLRARLGEVRDWAGFRSLESGPTPMTPTPMSWVSWWDSPEAFLVYQTR